MEGPCLAHCSCDTRTLVLARFAIGYVVACSLYLLLTVSVGTPFLDSLTEDQRRLKRCSSVKRGRIFLGCSFLSAGLLGVWKPLRSV